jgi:hypothetical protein
VGSSIDLCLLDTETYFGPLKDKWDLLGSSRPICAHKFHPSSPLILPVPVRVSSPPLPPPSRFLEDGQGREEPWPVSTRLSTKAGASGKFTRGSGVEVVPEASGGREIPSATEQPPEASAGREIPSASELALRAIAQWEMRSGSNVVDKKTMAGATASSSLSPEHNVNTISLHHFTFLICVPLSSPAMFGFRISVLDYCY